MKTYNDKEIAEIRAWKQDMDQKNKLCNDKQLLKERENSSKTFVQKAIGPIPNVVEEFFEEGNIKGIIYGLIGGVILSVIIYTLTYFKVL